jgi:hypothetical protein
MKFRYSSNGDGSYFVFYGPKIVAWCADKASAIYLRKKANLAQQGMCLDGGGSAPLEVLDGDNALSPYEHWLPSPARK